MRRESENHPTRALMRVKPDLALYTNHTQDRYFLVHTSGTAERISLPKASSLMAKGLDLGWEQLDAEEEHLDSSHPRSSKLR